MCQGVFEVFVGASEEPRWSAVVAWWLGPGVTCRRAGHQGCRAGHAGLTYSTTLVALSLNPSQTASIPPIDQRRQEGDHSDLRHPRPGPAHAELPYNGTHPLTHRLIATSKCSAVRPTQLLPTWSEAAAGTCTRLVVVGSLRLGPPVPGWSIAVIGRVELGLSGALGQGQSCSCREHRSWAMPVEFPASAMCSHPGRPSKGYPRRRSAVITR